MRPRLRSSIAVCRSTRSSSRDCGFDFCDQCGVFRYPWEVTLVVRQNPQTGGHKLAEVGDRGHGRCGHEPFRV